MKVRRKERQDKEKKDRIAKMIKMKFLKLQTKNIFLEIMADVKAIKDCCDDAILAFGGRPFNHEKERKEKQNVRSNLTESNRSKPNRTESNRSEPNRTESNRFDQDRTESNRFEPSQDIFHSPPRVEMAFKRVLKNMTIGECVLTV